MSIGAAPLPVTLTTPGQNATYSFTGTEGQQVTVRLSGNSIGGTRVRLRRADGTYLTVTSMGSSAFTLMPRTLSSTGDYIVQIDPMYGNAAHADTISVQVTSP